MERFAPSAAPAWRFQHLVAKIFEGLNFTSQQDVVFNVSDNPSKINEVDVSLTFGESRSLVEVKTFRSRTPRIPDIKRAADRVLAIKSGSGADHAVLVLNMRRDKMPGVELINPDVIIFGIDDLIYYARSNGPLLAELSETVRELNSSLADFDSEVDLSPAHNPTSVRQLMVSSSGIPQFVAVEARGRRFACDLQAIESGKTKKQTLPSGASGVNWNLFEKVGQASLEYLFESELRNWQAQKSAGGDYARLDVMAKICGDDVFSKTLIEDFKSRYILFEFKNYEDPIGSNPVHITEKYLFPTALRSTVIMISPKGFSDAAHEAARGAIRDAGKLVLDLPVPTLCEMLLAKDGGTPPSERMEEILDRFLLSLGR